MSCWPKPTQNLEYQKERVELFRQVRANFCLLPCDMSQEPNGNCSEKKTYSDEFSISFDFGWFFLFWFRRLSVWKTRGNRTDPRRVSHRTPWNVDVVALYCWEFNRRQGCGWESQPLSHKFYVSLLFSDTRDWTSFWILQKFREGGVREKFVANCAPNLLQTSEDWERRKGVGIKGVTNFIKSIFENRFIIVLVRGGFQFSIWGCNFPWASH